MNTAAEKEVLTWNDVASLLRVSPRNARRVARRIGLVPVRLGHRTVRFGLSDVERAMERAGLKQQSNEQ